jgi:hypothetical protein
MIQELATGPQNRLSWELNRLSPSTNQCPGGIPADLAQSHSDCPDGHAVA